ncbi:MULTISPECIES: hypothetical protein [unclassified Streptomyces]|uniref:hypothetical protein n=1 Tax=unclassified Streptomyces TaxID=2593676 RepID=UPI0022507CDD|nr:MULTISPECIES: hypothetical protein [unclassified Streptomyces]MCX4398716.1 hypothetical protein [Streptomyces sp. NBC_01767]WSP51012.1 hypothetical protein OG348_37075 [Streptomyces sp. NBC_01243]
MRVRDDLATMFCKRVGTKIKKAKEELEEILLAEREIVEALIGNYRTVLKNIDADGAQEAVQKAAAMTAEVRHALEGLDDESPVDEVAQRLGGKVSPAVLEMAKALVVQAGGLGAVTEAVEGFGGFVQQHEQIEKVSAHHGNFWEVLLYGQIGRDRAVMFDLAEKLEFTETSEDRRVLDALAHAQRHQSARGEHITAFDEEGGEVDISFATQNWRKAVVDKTRTGQFVRKHFEAMVFTALAEELRTGDVAVVGSEEYADWSKQLLDCEAMDEAPELPRTRQVGGVVVVQDALDPLPRFERVTLPHVAGLGQLSLEEMRPSAVGEVTGAELPNPACWPRPGILSGCSS